jgi:putative Mg2+ transporter-C (MgtC) family protein
MIPGLDFGSDWATPAVRLAAALLAGAVLGVNRDLHRKPAGLRTHALVSIGSATIVLVALAIANGSGEALSRVIQGLITGIGFLGAGVIIHHEAGQRVEGLTTAASVWVAAALGAACGAGLAAIALLALVATMLVLLFGGKIERAFEKRFLEDQPPPR